jgi:hypothetical protein
MEWGRILMKLVCHENLNSEEGDDPLFLYDENVDCDDDDILEVHHIPDDVVERPPIRSASIRARHRLIRGVDSEMDNYWMLFINEVSILSNEIYERSFFKAIQAISFS